MRSKALLLFLFSIISPWLQCTMMNCFCRMVDWRMVLGLICSWNHCQGHLPLQTSNTLYDNQIYVNENWNTEASKTNYFSKTNLFEIVTKLTSVYCLQLKYGVIRKPFTNFHEFLTKFMPRLFCDLRISEKNIYIFD